MTQISKRARRIRADKIMDKGSGKFESIDLTFKNVASWMTGAWKNNHYVVMVDDNAETTHGPAIRIMVQKYNDTPILNHWSEMQKIKNTLFGKDAMAIEYYPPAGELVDKFNIYWMWIFKDGVIPKPLKP